MNNKLICLFMASGFIHINNCKAQQVALFPVAGYHFTANTPYVISEAYKKDHVPRISGSYHIGINSEVGISKLNKLGLGIIFSNGRRKLQRPFVYPDFYFESGKVIEDYSINWIKMPLSLVHRFKNTSLYCSVSMSGKINIRASRSGVIYETFPPTEYSDNFKLRTKNNNSIGLCYGGSLGYGFKINKSKLITSLFFDRDISKWGYPTFFEKEKKQYYPYRAVSLGITIGYCPSF